MSEIMPRYAIAEIERRWLVDATAVGDLAHFQCRHYEDLYIDSSRLRLRKITGPNGSALYKLGKKYGKRSTLSEPITTIYLNEPSTGSFVSFPVALHPSVAILLLAGRSTSTSNQYLVS
jgi:hypothetical protein